MPSEIAISFLDDYNGSNNSIKTYALNIDRIIKSTGKGFIESIKDMKDTYDAVIKEYPSYNTNRITLSFPLNFIKNINKDKYKFSKKVKKYWEDVAKFFQKDSNEKLNNVRKDNYIYYEELIKVRDDPKTDTIAKLLLSIYTMIPPRRLTDYYALHIIKKKQKTYDNKRNYIIIPKKKNSNITLIINKFKTSDKMGSFVKELPDNIATLIKNYVKPEQKYLFTDAKGNKFKTSTSFGTFFTNRLKKYFEKPVSVNTIRHAYIDWFLSKKNITTSDKKKLAYDMGQTNIATQDSYRTNEPEDKEKDEFFDALEEQEEQEEEFFDAVEEIEEEEPKHNFNKDVLSKFPLITIDKKQYYLIPKQ